MEDVRAESSTAEIRNSSGETECELIVLLKIDRLEKDVEHKTPELLKSRLDLSTIWLLSARIRGVTESPMSRFISEEFSITMEEFSIITREAASDPIKSEILELLTES